MMNMAALITSLKNPHFSQRKRECAEAAAQQSAVQAGQRPPRERCVAALTALGLTGQGEALSDSFFSLRNQATVFRVTPASSEKSIHREALTGMDRLQNAGWLRSTDAPIRNDVPLACTSLGYVMDREDFASNRCHPRLLHESRMRRVVADSSSRFSFPLAIEEVQKFTPCGALRDF
jgi:hypothetical protein